MKKISYCTAVYKRLWQLEKTLQHNVQFTLDGSAEICIAAYNDPDIYPWLLTNFTDHIKAGRIRIAEFRKDHPWSAGMVKNMAHRMALGEIVFNLDADNFIDGAHDVLMNLEPNQITITDYFGGQRMDDGRIGRIGLYRSVFNALGGYKENIGSHHDGELVARALLRGCSAIVAPCTITPIPNFQ